MMKLCFTFLFIGSLFSSCGEPASEEKNNSVPSSEIRPLEVFKPRGDLVTAYEHVYSHSGDKHWVEVYLFTSEDSIIITEMEKPSKDSREAPAIYCFEVSRKQLDVSSLVALDYNAVKEPAGMKKVSMEVKDGNNMVLQWVSDPQVNNGKRDSGMVTGIRVLTKDEVQANEIMERLKSGF